MKITSVVLLTLILLDTACGTTDREKTPHTIPSTTSAKETPAANNKTAKAYTAAIAAYMNAVYTGDKLLPDTLFIGRRPDFPDISFPVTINETPVLLLTEQEARARQPYHPSLTYLNVIGWTEQAHPEFLIVTFAGYFKPQFNCSIYLDAATGNDAFALDSLAFDYPYGKAQKH